ncbi:MAG: porin family protein [Rhodothermales bacterium]
MSQRLLFCLGVCALLSLTLPVRAQQWTGSLKIGSAVTNFTGGEKPSPEFRTSLVGGVALGYDFGNGLILQPELLYVTKGAYADREIDTIPIRLRSDLTYLDIPFLVHYRFQGSGYMHPRLFAGPFLAFLLNAKVSFRAKGSDVTQTEDADDATSVDYGAVAGAGLEVEVGGQRLLFEARAFFGRANAREEDPPLQNMGAVFFVGIVF